MRNDLLTNDLQQLNKIFEKLNKLYWAQDADGSLLFISPLVEKWIGITVEEILSKPGHYWKNYVHPDDRQKIIDSEGLLLKGDVLEVDYRLIHQQTGRICWVNSKTIPEFDETGNLTLLSGIITDVSEQYGAIDQLRHAEERMGYELSIAKEVQKSVFSQNIANADIQIAGMYKPSKELGGDMYVWYKIDERRYGVFVSDIMGKGVAASLVAMSIRSLLKGLITKVTEPVKVIEELNQHMVTLYKEHRAVIPYYFTCFYAVIDINKCEIEYISCGHPPAILLDPSNYFVSLESTNIPVGMLSMFEPVKVTTTFRPGSRLIICTDGIFELLDGRINQSVEKLVQLVSVHDQLTAEQLVQSLTHQVIGDDMEYRDDLTFVAVVVGDERSNSTTSENSLICHNPVKIS